MVQPERHRYLASIASELDAQSNRVRDLIGNVHWFSDGHHREQLLLSLIQRHLPTGVIASRGFVIDSTDPNGCSKEQDILIIDTQYEAPVLHQGGLAICFPSSVIVSISVKTVMDSKTVRETFEGLSSVRNVAKKLDDPQSLLLMGFFFESSDAIANDPQAVKKYILGGLNDFPCRPPSLLREGVCFPRGLDVMCTCKDMLYRLKYDDCGANEGPRLLGHKCVDIAAALFISLLLGHVTTRRGAAHASLDDFIDGAEYDLVVDERIEPLTA